MECFYTINLTDRIMLRLTPFPKDGVTPGEAHNFGWRPLIWTTSLAAAEKYASRIAAEIFFRGSVNPGSGWFIKEHGTYERGAA